MALVLELISNIKQNPVKAFYMLGFLITFNLMSSQGDTQELCIELFVHDKDNPRSMLLFPDFPMGKALTYGTRTAEPHFVPTAFSPLAPKKVWDYWSFNNVAGNFASSGFESMEQQYQALIDVSKSYFQVKKLFTFSESFKQGVYPKDAGVEIHIFGPKAIQGNHGNFFAFISGTIVLRVDADSSVVQLHEIGHHFFDYYFGHSLNHFEHLAHEIDPITLGLVQLIKSDYDSAAALIAQRFKPGFKEDDSYVSSRTAAVHSVNDVQNTLSKYHELAADLTVATITGQGDGISKFINRNRLNEIDQLAQEFSTKSPEVSPVLARQLSVDFIDYFFSTRDMTLKTSLSPPDFKGAPLWFLNRFAERYSEYMIGTQARRLYFQALQKTPKKDHQKLFQKAISILVTVAVNELAFQYATAEEAIEAVNLAFAKLKE